MPIKYITILFVISFLISCDQGVEPDPLLGRIIISESIDGVKIGDNTSTVILKLGPPTAISYPDFPGEIYEYSDGMHATMYVAIYAASETPSGVFSISVISPFNGKTSEGVGLGMDRNSVLAKIGNPTESPPTDNGQLDRYIFEKVHFELFYENGVVSSLNLSINRNGMGGGA
jgi:hypothetical protein